MVTDEMPLEEVSLKGLRQVATKRCHFGSLWVSSWWAGARYTFSFTNLKLYLLLKMRQFSVVDQEGMLNQSYVLGTVHCSKSPHVTLLVAFGYVLHIPLDRTRTLKGPSPIVIVVTWLGQQKRPHTTYQLQVVLHLCWRVGNTVSNCILYMCQLSSTTWQPMFFLGMFWDTAHMQ